jgi:RNA polymerase sigma factor (sigma-70 family)
MVSLRHRSADDDSELARRVGAGDPGAFATLDARHRKALTRYAGTLLRRSEHDAEDVVQDVLIRAHEALLCGEGPVELRPWLYRLTRNRAIDEVRRKRWGDESLDSEHVFGDSREEPEAVLMRRETVHRLVQDLADLPVRQRTALLARELDGLDPAQVAAQLGVSVPAAQKLAIHARANLIKTRDARDAACSDVRAALLDAHERGVRPSEHGLRHLKGCNACRAYQRDIRRLSRQLHALNPYLGLPLLAGVVKLVGVGGTKAAAGVLPRRHTRKADSRRLHRPDRAHPRARRPEHHAERPARVGSDRVVALSPGHEGRGHAASRGGDPSPPRAGVHEGLDPGLVDDGSDGDRAPWHDEPAGLHGGDRLPAA